MASEEKSSRSQPCPGEAQPEVFGGVLWSERGEVEAMGHAGVQGAIAASSEPIVEFWQADEDECYRGL